jgi:hypothetical protein
VARRLDSSALAAPRASFGKRRRLAWLVAVASAAGSGAVSPAAGGGQDSHVYRLTPDVEEARIAGIDWRCTSGRDHLEVTVTCSGRSSYPWVDWGSDQSLTILTTVPPKVSTRFRNGRPYAFAFPFRHRLLRPTYALPLTVLTVRRGDVLLLPGLPHWRCESGPSPRTFTCAPKQGVSFTLAGTPTVLYVAASRPLVSFPTGQPGRRLYLVR